MFARYLQRTNRTSDNQKPPGMLRRAGNAGKAAGRVTKAKVNRKKVKASPDIIAKRREICNSCDQLKGNFCQQKACGCYLPVKTTLLTEDCPLGKWPKTN